MDITNLKNTYKVLIIHIKNNQYSQRYIEMVESEINKLFEKRRIRLSKALDNMLRHAAASHWLEDGMNVVQISYLLCHEQLQTTMTYLEITTAQKAKALDKLDDTNNVQKKWKKDIKKLSDGYVNRTGSLSS